MIGRVGRFMLRRLSTISVTVKAWDDAMAKKRMQRIIACSLMLGEQIFRKGNYTETLADLKRSLKADRIYKRIYLRCLNERIEEFRKGSIERKEITDLLFRIAHVVEHGGREDLELTLEISPHYRSLIRDGFPVV